MVKVDDLPVQRNYREPVSKKTWKVPELSHADVAQLTDTMSTIYFPKTEPLPRESASGFLILQHVAV